MSRKNGSQMWQQDLGLTPEEAELFQALNLSTLPPIDIPTLKAELPNILKIKHMDLDLALNLVHYKAEQKFDAVTLITLAEKFPQLKAALEDSSLEALWKQFQDGDHYAPRFRIQKLTSASMHPFDQFAGFYLADYAVSCLTLGVYVERCIEGIEKKDKARQIDYAQDIIKLLPREVNKNIYDLCFLVAYQQQNNDLLFKTLTFLDGNTDKTAAEHYILKQIKNNQEDPASTETHLDRFTAQTIKACRTKAEALKISSETYNNIASTSYHNIRSLDSQTEDLIVLMQSDSSATLNWTFIEQLQAHSAKLELTCDIFGAAAHFLYAIYNRDYATYVEKLIMKQYNPQKPEANLGQFENYTSMAFNYRLTAYKHVLIAAKLHGNNSNLLLSIFPTGLSGIASNYPDLKSTEALTAYMLRGLNELTDSWQVAAQTGITQIKLLVDTEYAKPAASLRR